jgi:hypothetical protein
MGFLGILEGKSQFMQLHDNAGLVFNSAPHGIEICFKNAHWVEFTLSRIPHGTTARTG